jgi:hypothetical protein
MMLLWRCSRRQPVRGILTIRKVLTRKTSYTAVWDVSVDILITSTNTIESPTCSFSNETASENTQPISTFNNNTHARTHTHTHSIITYNTWFQGQFRSRIRNKRHNLGSQTISKIQTVKLTFILHYITRNSKLILLCYSFPQKIHRWITTILRITISRNTQVMNHWTINIFGN